MTGRACPEAATTPHRCSTYLPRQPSSSFFCLEIFQKPRLFDMSDIRTTTCVRASVPFFLSCTLLVKKVGPPMNPQDSCIRFRFKIQKGTQSGRQGTREMNHPVLLVCVAGSRRARISHHHHTDPASVVVAHRVLGPALGSTIGSVSNHSSCFWFSGVFQVLLKVPEVDICI